MASTNINFDTHRAKTKIIASTSGLTRDEGCAEPDTKQPSQTLSVEIDLSVSSSGSHRLGSSVADLHNSSFIIYNEIRSHP
jgi:hypothetical protein